MEHLLSNRICANAVIGELSQLDQFALELTCRATRAAVLDFWRTLRSYSIAMLHHHFNSYWKILEQNGLFCKASDQTFPLEENLANALLWLLRRSPHIQDLTFDAPEFLEIHGRFAEILSRFERVTRLTITVNSAHLWCGSQDFRSIKNLLALFGPRLRFLQLLYDPRVNLLHSFSQDSSGLKSSFDSRSFSFRLVPDNSAESLWKLWSQLGSLEELNFQNVSVCDLFLAKHLPNKSNLQALRITASKCPRTCGDTEELSELLPSFTNLARLRLRIPPCAIPPDSYFVNLKFLSVTIRDSFWSCNELAAILRASGPALSDLDVRCSNCENLESVCTSIAKTVPSATSITSLTLAANSDGLSLKWLRDLTLCPKLKKLELGCLFLIPKVDLSIFWNFHTLETLKIRACIPKEVCLSPLKRIPHLRRAELWIQSHSERETYERHALEISDGEAEVRIRFKHDIFEAFPSLRSYRRLSPME